MSEKKLEECSLEDATHVEVNGKVYLLESDKIALEYHNGECIGLGWVKEGVWIPIELFPILGIKPLREAKPEPIEFEFIPSLEMVKDSWLGELIPMEAVGKKFKCVQILEEEK